LKKYSAEFLGTMLLTLFGCGASVIMLAGVQGAALAFGLTFIAIYYTISKISGCHINPAVSLAMLINKKLSVEDFVGYVVAQCMGAITGAGVLAFIFNNMKDYASYKQVGLATNGFGDYSYLGFSIKGAIVLEIFLSFLFVLSFLGATSSKKTMPVAGLIIGLSLAAVYFFGVPFTGGSANPARSFGPALFMRGEQLKQVWVFVLFPFVGATLAAFVWKFLNSTPKLSATEQIIDQIENIDIIENAETEI